ncbi:MAG: DegT/DnrJ/EryC1/StrS family aminotransferase [Pseudomonadota bacterium]
MSDSWISLSDPDISQAELEAAGDVLRSPRISAGERVAAFETAFAAWLGRRHAIAVPSGTLGLLLCLTAYGIGPGDEIVLSPYSRHQIGHAVALRGARSVFADIDYWSGTIAPESARQLITANTRAVLAGNTNGHPAPWSLLRTLAQEAGVPLLEDSSEAIGSRYEGSLVGSFGDCAIFDFSQPSPLVCGEGGIIVTDDDDLAGRLRHHRAHGPREQASVVASTRIPYQAAMSDLSAAIGLVQLSRLDGILARRRQVEVWYYEYMKSFEGIKDPYRAPEATEVHWHLYEVHLGTRFSRSSRDAIVEDLRKEEIEAAPYCHPMHLQGAYRQPGTQRVRCPTVERVADRTLVLPFHGHLQEEQIAFIIQTLKDASVNVGAGAAIYL